MSTYTDLKNRVKETITVGFRPEDRVTTQKVRFYNEENEYWGSFSGSLSGKVNIKTGNILSVDIYDSTLINPVLKTKEGTIIDLGTMGNQLEELSVHVHENVKTSVDTNYELITQLSDVISAVPLDTESQLSSLDFRLNNLSTECKQAMSDEVSARISSDNQLSLSFDNKLITLAQYVDKEDEKLKSEINNLSEQLNTEITTRISEDEKLSVNLSKYSDRKRHYDLFSMDMASQMPIKAKEFAVNKLINYNVPDGFVINGNAAGQVIGHIEDYNDTTKACKFTAYSDADYTVTNEDGTRLYPYTQILGLNPYIFDESQTQKPCANNVHVLSYNRLGTFNEHQFDIRLMKSNIRNIVYGGSVIGHIFGAGTGNDVSSGVVQFSPTALINNNILSVFADNKEIPFSINLNNGEIKEYDNGNSILRIQQSYPRFEFETGISSWPQKIVFNESGTEFGARIYQEYYIKSNNNVESFAVSMRPKHDLTLGQQDYFLSASNDFKTIIKKYDDNSFDLLKYDFNDKKLSYTCEKKLFECSVIINDNNKTINLYLKSKVFNKSLDVTDKAEISFNELSNAVQESMLPLINQTYELIRNNDVLSCDITDAFGSRVKIVIKNTGKIDITLSAANGATAIFGDDNDRVEFNTLTVYEDQTDNLGIEHNLDINDISFDTTDRRVAAQGYLYITEASENSNEFRGLNFCKEYTSNKYQEIRNNDIVIEIPNKEDGSTISREFLFVIYPISNNINKVNLKFVTEQGDPIDFFTQGNDKFEIDCRKYITFRLQEITHNKFVLLDWDQSVQEARLDNLDSSLEQEISDRITAINNLSTALSTEIELLSSALSNEIIDLSTGLSTEIDNLSTVLSIEISSLSGNVYEILDIHSGKLSADRKDINFLLEVDKESMVYKGTLLSVDDIKDKTLSCYFKAALGINEDPQFMFKHGFTYRISADQNLIDHNNTNIVLHLGDVITFNQDSRISSVCAEDFDIIHDYQIPLNNLSTALSTEISSLSVGLSTEIDNLSTALSTEIKSLSSALSNEIIGLSTALSTEIDNKFTLQSTTSKLSGEYNDLNNFVNRTLIDENDQSKPGIVKIQDEYDYVDEDTRNYEMRMISGTIVLKLI